MVQALWWACVQMFSEYLHINVANQMIAKIITDIHLFNLSILLTTAAQYQAQIYARTANITENSLSLTDHKLYWANNKKNRCNHHTDT